MLTVPEIVTVATEGFETYRKICPIEDVEGKVRVRADRELPVL
jgi:hypothetical protein